MNAREWAVAQGAVTGGGLNFQHHAQPAHVATTPGAPTLPGVTLRTPPGTTHPAHVARYLLRAARAACVLPMRPGSPCALPTLPGAPSTPPVFPVPCAHPPAPPVPCPCLA